MATILQCAANRCNVCHGGIHVVGVRGAVIRAGAAALGYARGNPFVLENLAQGLTDVVQVVVFVGYRHVVPIAGVGRGFAEIAMLAEHEVGVHHFGEFLLIKRIDGVVGTVTFRYHHRGAVCAFETHDNALFESAGGGVAVVNLLSDK